MRSLDEILLGSLVFFIIDRTLRLSSNAKYGDRKTVHMLALELAMLVGLFAFILKFRKMVNAVNI
jgi:hypothetical protein